MKELNGKPIAFCDLPDSQRIACRDAIDAAGGDVAGYYGECVQVNLPRPSGPFLKAMEAIGLELKKDSLWFFPLGSDRAPEHQRHDGNYPGSRGFWLCGNFRVREWTPEEILRNEG